MADVMDTRAKEILRQGDRLFTEKGVFDTLCQEIALQFYYERADFTSTRDIGDEHADHAFSSYPALARRELANLLSSFLRPTSLPWFSMHVEDEELDEERVVREYLEMTTKRQRLAMYHPHAGFVRSTKQGDNDYAAFGNAVIHVGPNPERTRMRYINHHLRDCAWSDDSDGNVDILHRKGEPTARQLKQLFPGKISKEVEKMCEKDPDKKVPCRYAVLPSRVYYYKGKTGKQYPYTSLIVERASETILEEVGLNYFPYVVPRWSTIEGTPYGRSLATEIVLPDARTIQVVTRTLREAGEMYVNPPMIAAGGDVIRGDINLYAGGITEVDREYDEKLGEALRPVTKDKSGMPIGFEIAAALRDDIRNGFFLDKIQLPETGRDMTATEVRRRIEEHVRQAAPLFEPVEKEYNVPLCEKTFEVMRAHGAFQDVPEELIGSDVKFTFRSPLSDMAEENEAEIALEGIQTIALPLMEMDPSLGADIDWQQVKNDALRAKGWKAKWFRDNGEKLVRQAQQQIEQQRQLAQTADTVERGGQVAEQVGKGVNELTAGGK